MLQSLDEFTGDAASQVRVRKAFQRAQAWLAESPPRGDRSLVQRAEHLVAQSPEAVFDFSQNSEATLRVGEFAWSAGRFACRSLGSLLSSIPGPGGTGKLRLFVLAGLGPLTDIGTLQGLAPPESMFQVASQFNCLEAPGPSLVPVRQYLTDPTQGPRASISAFPGTLLRHYAAPGENGRRFTQTDPTPQLNLLGRVAPPPLARVRNGYLLPENIPDPQALACALTERFEDIEVGVHERTEVVFGTHWDGPVLGRPLIGQVFTSTLAAGAYGRVDFDDPRWHLVARQLLRAAYLGTLAAAAATGQRRVVLTLIGGGVFGNPIPVIWDNVLWACQQIAPRLSHDLTVVLNGRDLSGLDRQAVTAATRLWGGDLLTADLAPSER